MIIAMPIIIIFRITPLMYACRARDPEVVEELIKHSSNIDACDTDGKTVRKNNLTCLI